jgi:hypothetical protein
MMHDCAYCHKQTKMELVGGMQIDGQEGIPQKLWYRCTRCKHSALLTLEANSKEKSGHAKIDRTSAIEYAKEKVFTVGQAIYHSGLDDVGRVVKKDKTSGGIHSILVSFEKTGERKLLENIQHEFEETVSP